jgi:O-antigen/teichoic acid export membrane protein
LFLILFGDKLLAIYGPGYAQAYPSLIVLVIAQLVNTLCGPVGALLTMTGHEWYTFWVLGFSTLVNVILTILLIPFWGLAGAAVASASTTIFWIRR